MNNGNKIINFNAASSLVIFFILLFFFSKWGPSLPITVLSQQKGEPFIVSGEGKVFVTPDIARLTFGIQENGTSLKSVQDSVSKKSKALTEALKRQGIDEKDIKTSSYSVYPQYDYQASEQRITGFQVSINYDVKIKDFDKVNEAITAATGAGANMVGGINFEVNDETKEEKLSEARKIAVAEAKQKAEGLAKAAGLNLGKVINVSENEGNYGGPIMMTRDLAVGQGGAEIAPSPEITPGETQIQVNVSLSYEIR